MLSRRKLPASRATGAGVNDPARQQLFSALLLLVMALFVSAGLPLAPRWRRRLRVGTIAGIAILAVAVLFEIALWLAGSGGWR